MNEKEMTGEIEAMGKGEDSDRPLTYDEKEQAMKEAEHE